MRKHEDHSVSRHLPAKFLPRDSGPYLGWWNVGNRRHPQALAQPHPLGRDSLPQIPNKQLFCPCPGCLNDKGHTTSGSSLPPFGEAPLIEFCNISLPVGVGPKILSLPAQVLGFCHHRLREQVPLLGLGESLELCLRQNLEQKQCTPEGFVLTVVMDRRSSALLGKDALSTSSREMT